MLGDFLPFPSLPQTKNHFLSVFLEGNLIVSLGKGHSACPQRGNSQFHFEKGIAREWLLILILQ